MHPLNRRTWHARWRKGTLRPGQVLATPFGRARVAEASPVPALPVPEGLQGSPILAPVLYRKPGSEGLAVCDLVPCPAGVTPPQHVVLEAVQVEGAPRGRWVTVWRRGAFDAAYADGVRAAAIVAAQDRRPRPRTRARRRRSGNRARCRAGGPSGSSDGDPDLAGPSSGGRRRREVPLVQDPPSREPGPEDLAALREDVLRLHLAISLLPSAMAEVMRLAAEGVEGREAARRLHRSPGTVGEARKAGLGRLREILEPDPITGATRNPCRS